MATVATVNTAIRSLMGDDDTAVYLDATLLTPINQGHRLIQQKLVNRGCSVLRDTSAVITLPAGATTLTAATTPALPADFMVPYKIWERRAGTTVADFQPMTKKDSELEDRTQFDYLAEWKFEGGGIEFVGATIDIDIKILYEKILADYTASANPLTIIGEEDALAFYGAAYAATSRGQDGMASYFEKKAAEAVDELVNRFVHSNQHAHGRRRRAYGR